MEGDSFVVVVPAGPDQFDLGVPHVTRAPEGDDSVAMTAQVTTMRLGLRGLLALKVQIESALITAKGEDWVRSLRTLVAKLDHGVSESQTWDLLVALEVARREWGLGAAELPPEAVAVEVCPADSLEAGG